MRRSAPAASALVLTAALAACSTPGTGNMGPLSVTPTEQFGIQIQQQPQRIQLAARTGELSPAQVQALSGLAADWRGGGGGPLTVEAPVGAQNSQAGFRAASAAAAFLSGQGLPPGAVVSTSYNAAGQVDAPVLVGFARQVAVGPNCAVQQSEFAGTFENRVSAGFGCANVANFAAQLADTSDLLAPKPMTPADATRRGVVLEGYRAGKPTGTPRSTNPRESADVEQGSR